MKEEAKHFNKRRKLVQFPVGQYSWYNSILKIYICLSTRTGTTELLARWYLHLLFIFAGLFNLLPGVISKLGGLLPTAKVHRLLRSEGGKQLQTNVINSIIPYLYFQEPGRSEQILWMFHCQVVPSHLPAGINRSSWDISFDTSSIFKFIFCVHIILVANRGKLLLILEAWNFFPTVTGPSLSVYIVGIILRSCKHRLENYGFLLS